MGWLEDTLGIGAEDLGNVLTGVGTVIDLWDDYDRKETNKAAAKFTRQRQILDVTAFIASQRRLKELNLARKGWMDTHQRAVLQGQRDYAAVEADYWRIRAVTDVVHGRERAADDALTRSIGFDRQSAALAVRGAELAAARRETAFQRQGNELLQSQALAEQEALSAERSLLDVETEERGRILAARQASVTAGMATVQARQAQVAGVLGTEVAARREEALMSAGAVAAGAGARGLSGSFEGTAGRQIQREASRDILQLGLGADAQMAQLEERQADLVLEGQRIGSEARLGAARDAVERAGLDAQGRGLEARRMALRGEEATLGGREAILQAQGAELEVDRLAIESGRQISERQYARDVVEADLAGRVSGLRAASSELDRTRAQADLADLEIDMSRLGAEVTMGDTAIAIADWTLQRAPELPDYDTFFFRSALGTLLGSGQGAWG